MEHIDQVVDLIYENDFMISIDLTDAYFSVRIHKDFRKYVRFVWRNTLYEYCCLCFGYAAAPRLFTKITKPILAHLHDRGIRISMYIDDMILMDRCKEKLVEKTNYTVSFLQKLGFKINFEKSELCPSNKIRHLGFIINSSDMVMQLPQDKHSKIASLCEQTLTNPKLSIRKAAELIGLLISACKGTKLGKLFYRDLERDKIQALKLKKGDFDKNMKLSKQAIENIRWWISSEVSIPAPFAFQKTTVFLQSDASMLGWGCVDKLSGKSTGGRWLEHESKLHINVLELKAAFFSILSFCSDKRNCTIQLELDNSTAISYINNMGGMIYELDKLAKQIWKKLHNLNSHIFASHIPGVLNTVADARSRIFHDPTEWSLADYAFQDIVRMLGNPDIDLFASRLNFKCNLYCSWEPDPLAYKVDAFSLDWSKFGLCYAFPPFNLIAKVIKKMTEDKAELLLIAPAWNTQIWYPLIESYLLEENSMISFHNSKKLLWLPYELSTTHSLWHRLNLCCFRLSGKH